MTDYKYIYPPNARKQEQLDIMLRLEAENKDPLDKNIIEQEVLFSTAFWYVSRNRFPYSDARQHFLIVANQPVYSVREMSVEMWDDLRRVWLKVLEEYAIDGGGLCMRFGNPALSGASLKRLHVHIIEPELNHKVHMGVGGKTELADGLHL